MYTKDSRNGRESSGGCLGRRPRAAMMVLAGVLASGIGAIRTSGHIVPPEELHPVAAAFRQCTFVLNLNPITWDLVRQDAETIEAYLTGLDAGLGAAFDKQYEAALQALEEEGEDSDPRAVRESTRRAVFEACTQALTKALVWQLDAVERAAPDRTRARHHLNEARELFKAFDDSLPRLDPTAYAKLGGSFLAAADSLGSQGLLDRGVKPVDVGVLRIELATIRGYISANFGDTFRAGDEARLLPRPRGSSTYSPTADVPVRLPPQANINKQIPRPRQILNMAARGVSELDTPLIAVGDMAFDSAYIFGEPAQSMSITCNTCHNKSITNPQFFIPGLSARTGGMDVSNAFFAPHANNGHYDPLDIPDLRGIRFTAPYGRNGRFASLREFVRNVIVNEFNGPEPDPLMLDGIIAYMNEFDFLTNPLLAPDGRLKPEAPARALRGEKIFHRPFAQMGGKSCATCHIPSNHFVDGQRHDIGSVEGYETNSRDRALDTPTLLSAKYTQPYFHDGRFETLGEVNEWFNNRYQLGLSSAELADLTAYVETISDGVEAYEDTIYYLDAELEEFSFFLSAYEFLRDKNKPRLADATFRTIALEIRNHKWELQDLSYVPVMEQLAQLMDEAYEANLAGDRDVVDEKVAAYRALFEKHVEHLK